MESFLSQCSFMCGAFSVVNAAAAAAGGGEGAHCVCHCVCDADVHRLYNDSEEEVEPVWGLRQDAGL